ncbi:uncharacterized protein SOCE26_070190 [Sorangium cellulosum]|uniref:Uncharacterized protein n=2 Tax=Sorangium cellulosum TaxID=56 RepID=A0A2L0F1T4_SORCE|nr:uncharacterized protein SOCE26_070190 [Sorangium cellulosum]
MNLGPDREEWATAKKYAAATWRSAWGKWSDTDRRTAAEDLLSPFKPDEATMIKFLDEVAAAIEHI